MYYTYLWLREDGTPYYVGKGKGGRGFTSSTHGVHKPANSERIVTQEWDSETEAFEAEKILISIYGRLDIGTGILRNLTDGGEGASGCIPSAEARKNMSRAGRGKQKPQDFVKRMVAFHTGRKRTQLTCKNISAAKRRNLFLRDVVFSWKRMYPETCSVAGCACKTRSMGFCSGHYAVLWRTHATVRQTTSHLVQPVQQAIFQF